jgi:cytoskeleton protein RodZ
LRNYARLMNLDADLLVAHLPDAAHAPSLEPPALHSTGTTMAELPTAHAHAPSLGRWLIPLVLIACIVAAAGFEWYRGRPARPAGPAAPPRATETVQPPGLSTTPLPNPVAPDAGAPGAATSPAPSGAPSSSGVEQVSPAAAEATAPNANAAADAVLVLRYDGPSWTEVRDQRGQILISRLVDAGSVEPFDGTPPFSIVIGNARAVTLVYRGQPVELAPYTRLNVARLVIR